MASVYLGKDSANGIFKKAPVSVKGEPELRAVVTENESGRKPVFRSDGMGHWLNIAAIQNK